MRYKIVLGLLGMVMACNSNAAIEASKNVSNVSASFTGDNAKQLFSLLGVSRKTNGYRYVKSGVIEFKKELKLPEVTISCTQSEKADDSGTFLEGDGTFECELNINRKNDRFGLDNPGCATEAISVRSSKVLFESLAEPYYAIDRESGFVRKIGQIRSSSASNISVLLDCLNEGEKTPILCEIQLCGKFK